VGLWFAAGAVLMLLPWPWTLIFIKPTNDKLLAMPLDAAGPQSRASLKAWGKYHGTHGVGTVPRRRRSSLRWSAEHRFEQPPQ
jgi:hypothetical protein